MVYVTTVAISPPGSRGRPANRGGRHQFCGGQVSGLQRLLTQQGDDIGDIDGEKSAPRTRVAVKRSRTAHAGVNAAPADRANLRGAWLKQ